MSPANPGAAGRPSTRDLELALFEKIDQRLDAVAEDLRDVRDRVIRIEAQDPSAKVIALENRVRMLEEWKARVAGQVAMIVVPIASIVGIAITVLFNMIIK